MSRILSLFTVATLSSLMMMSAACSDEDSMPVETDDGEEGGAGGEGAGGVDAVGGMGGAADPEPEPEPEPKVCPDATGVYDVEPAQTNLLFMLDRSGSMHLRVTGTDTRWMLTTAGLAHLVGTLSSDTVAGLQMFPAGDAPISCCAVTAGNYIDCGACGAGELPGPEARCESSVYSPFDVAMAPMSAGQADAITSAVSASDDEFYWGTPLAPALQGAVDGVSGLPMDGVTSIVLLSDGLPTSCDTTADPSANDIGRALDAVSLGAQLGVRTYVVGIDAEAASSDPATDLAVNLSLVAQAGGTGRYAGCEATNDCAYRVNVDNFEQALSDALEAIALDATSCAIELPDVEGGTPDYGAVNITIQSEGDTITVPRDQAHADGWDYLPGNEQVQLYGGACELLKSDGEAKIKVVVGCQTEEI
ncbi:MAG: VWA domain-containing protein [Polyangiaceae bacterium]|nr:VWA domain-containing protein [Polyangiaceae bacterium]